MTTNDYHFVDCWRVEGDIKEVADILEDALSLPRWWGSVYFEVKEIEPGREHGIGKLISLRAGGWLPYTLRIDFRTVESRYPYGFSMDATGDLEGKGIWTFEPDRPFVNVTYDWTIRANKPIIEKLECKRVAKCFLGFLEGHAVLDEVCLCLSGIPLEGYHGELRVTSSSP